MPPAAIPPVPLSLSASPVSTSKKPKHTVAIVLAILAAIGVGIVVLVAVTPDSWLLEPMEEGSCFGSFEEFETDLFYSAQPIPCEEPHALEVYSVSTASLQYLDDYPGDVEVDEIAAVYCEQRFETFVGLAWEESQLDYWLLRPSKESWEDWTDREIVCLVGRVDRALSVGTLRGYEQ